MQSIAPAPIAQMQSHGHHHGIQEMSADNDLRAQLTAVVNSSQQQQQQHHHQGPPPPGLHGYSDPRASSSASPHDHNIDPAIGGPGGMMSAGPGGDNDDDDSMGDGRKGGKRELSQSKRAAQNRAAQRAFRQRKEGYIKKLEEQVRELHSLEDNFKAIQSENYSLREYIIHLQSRLIESQGDLPPPPPNVNLAHPGAVRHEGAPMAPMSQLQASAARGIAAAGLGKEDHFDKSRYKGGPSAEETPTDEDVIRAQLQASASHHV